MKKMKFCMIVALALLFSSNAFGYTFSDTTIAGEKYFKIQNCTDMAEFAKYVNDKKENLAQNAIVTHEINMDDAGCPDFTMMGRQDREYKGIFDGQYYPIKGLKINVSDQQNVGLFAAITDGAYLKNFIVQDVDIVSSKDKSSSGNTLLGGLVGWVRGGTIEGCYISGKVTGTGKEQGVGGIVGGALNGIIKDCYSHVDVEATKNSYAGGIIGIAQEPCFASWSNSNSGVTISSSVFDGKIIAKDGAIAGGIVGYSGEKAPKSSCSVELHDFYQSLFYDITSAEFGVGTGNTANNPSYPNASGEDNNYTRTGIPETFDMNSRHTVCLLNGGTWIESSETCKDPTSDTWAGDESGISNGAGVFDSTGNATYLITFDPNGGTFATGATTSKRLARDSAITSDGISTPTKAGYGLAGWSLDKGASAPSSLGVVDKAKNVYAVWVTLVTLTAIYVDNNGTEQEFPVTVLSTDDSATIQTKILAAYAALDLGSATPTKAKDSQYEYTFKNFEKGTDNKYRPTFTSSAYAKTIQVKADTDNNGVNETFDVSVSSTDTKDEIIGKINTALSGKTFYKMATEDSTFAFNNTWSVSDDGLTYTPNFTGTLITDTLLVKYGNGADDNVTVVVPRAKKGTARSNYIDSVFKAVKPSVVVEKTDGSEDSTYVFDAWVALTNAEGDTVKVDEKLVYVPSFIAIPIEAEIIVVYDSKGNSFKVVVYKADDVPTRISKVDSALTAKGIVPSKDDSSDSTYIFNGSWEVSVDGKTYTPKFKSWPKHMDVTVGEESVQINVPKDSLNVDKDGNIIVNIKVVVDGVTTDIPMHKGDKLDSVAKAMGVNPTKASTWDSTYEFIGWTPILDKDGNPILDSNGNNIYGPVFKGIPKTTELVIRYVDGEDDFINVVVHVADTLSVRIAKIDSALKANGIVPTKQEDEDSTYKYNGKWTVSGNDNEIYSANFTGRPKFIEVVVGGETIEVVVPPDTVADVDPYDNPGSGDDGKVVVIIKVVVGSDTFEVPVSDGDVLDSAIKKVIKEDPTKQETIDTVYEFAGWQPMKDSVGNVVKDEYGNKFYEPKFTPIPKTTELVVKYGDGEADTIHVVVAIVDNDSVRIFKIDSTLKVRHIVPTKTEDSDSTYVFNGKWTKTEDGYKAEFTGKPKFIEVVVGGDTIKVVIPDDSTSGGSGDVNPGSDDDDGDKPGSRDDGDEDENKIVVVVKVVVDGDTMEVAVSEGDVLDSVANNVVKDVPTKMASGDSSYEFAGWQPIVDSAGKEVRDDNGNLIYEPKFESFISFAIKYVLPKNGKMSAQLDRYIFGRKTALPGAYIDGADEWEFKGWYTKKDGLGKRVKMMVETDCGNVVLYPLFQKMIAYDANGVSGEVEILYDDNSEKNVARALERVVPEDYEEDGVNYTFGEWKLEDGVFVAKFTVATSIGKTVAPRFSVVVDCRTLEISGARMGANIAVYDMRGQLKATSVVSNGTQLLELGVPGRYVIRIDNQSIPVSVR